jgi:predicted metal-dependent peptidase
MASGERQWLVNIEKICQAWENEGTTIKEEIEEKSVCHIHTFDTIRTTEVRLRQIGEKIVIQKTAGEVTENVSGLDVEQLEEFNREWERHLTAKPDIKGLKVHRGWSIMTLVNSDDDASLA